LKEAAHFIPVLIQIFRKRVHDGWLTATFRIDETVFTIVLRIEDVTGVPAASMPSMTAPSTGGVVNRTKRALGAS
jgi:hypothetical protein